MFDITNITDPVPTMAGGCVLVGWGCGCTWVEVRSEFSNKFKYVLFPSMLTNPWPSTAEVNITSEFPPFTGTLTPSDRRRGRGKRDRGKSKSFLFLNRSKRFLIKVFTWTSTARTLNSRDRDIKNITERWMSWWRVRSLSSQPLSPRVIQRIVKDDSRPGSVSIAIGRGYKGN